MPDLTPRSTGVEGGASLGVAVGVWKLGVAMRMPGVVKGFLLRGSSPRSLLCSSAIPSRVCLTPQHTQKQHKRPEQGVRHLLNPDERGENLLGGDCKQPEVPNLAGFLGGAHDGSDGTCDRGQEEDDGQSPSRPVQQAEQ